MSALTLEAINTIFNNAYPFGRGFEHNASNDAHVAALNALGATEADAVAFTETEEFKAHSHGFHALREFKRWYKANTKGTPSKRRAPKAPKAEPKKAEPKAEPKKAEPKTEPKAKAEPKAEEHEKFNACLNVVRTAGMPLLMTGPAGCGKSYTAEKVATECGATKFFTQSKVMFDTDLKGYMDAYGNYVSTALYRAMKRADGGERTAFFLDEIFAGDTSCLIVINDLLSDGKMSFPNGDELSADNLVIIAADNTNGNGATNQFNTRNKADKSFLNRFGVVHFDYDKRVEKKLAAGHDDILEFIRAIRAAAEHVDLDVVCSYRTIKGMVKYADAGIDAAESVNTFVVQDALTNDDKDTLRQDAKIERLIAKGNVYAAAL